ncbi:type VI secretion system Vgr family protein [Methylosinus sporium]|uniref:type VI secretion system Vgr family protein n=1 Tax=Methylosinus sporium TaxID=428 RepID=UPI00383A8DEF
MDSRLDQQKRLAAFKSPFGDEALVVESFEGTEGLSELCEFRVLALSREPTIDFDQALGRSCSVVLRTSEGGARHFSGIATEAEAIGRRGDLFAYRFVLRPSLWLLTRTSNCAIWHRKTAIEIIEEVLRKREIDFRKALSGDFPRLDYCVQYRESDFAFVSRLMEQHGVYYFFEHDEDGAKLVLADSASSHRKLSSAPTIEYASKEFGSIHAKARRLYGWSSNRKLQTGKVTLRDYNFAAPNADMSGEANATERYDKSTLEYYDYPGKYEQRDIGKHYAQIRLEAAQAADYRRFADGDAADFFPGALVSVTRHPTDEENKEYLIARCAHRFVAEGYRSGARTDARPYQGSYELHPSDRPFRAPLATPKPMIHGPQTAKVVARKGKESEEIDVDDDGYGRVMVRFYWDRDDLRSCWVRVAQMWAGAKWGGQFIPRVGMEVVVEFLEGDPDRPLIVGAVYNRDNGLPYDLPANKTQSGVKSNSSTGGSGYNELLFEDAKLAEKIRLHAERDLESVIEHAETREIGARFETPVGQSSRKTTIKMGDDELDVMSGDRKVTIASEDKLTVGMSREATIALSDKTTVGANQSVNVGGEQTTQAGGAITIEAGGEVTIMAGATITLVAGVSIVLEAGGATFTVGPGVINAVGPMQVPGPLTAVGVVAPVA